MASFNISSDIDEAARITEKPEIRANLSETKIEPSPRELKYKMSGTIDSFPVWDDLFPLLYKGKKYHASVIVQPDKTRLRISRGEQCYSKKPDNCIELDITDTDLDHMDEIISYYVAELHRSE